MGINKIAQTDLGQSYKLDFVGLTQKARTADMCGRGFRFHF